MTDPVTRWRAAAIAAASLPPFSGARGEPNTAEPPAAQPNIADLRQRLEQQEQKIQALQQRLEGQDEQDQKISVLERRLEIQDETALLRVSRTVRGYASRRSSTTTSAPSA